MKEPNTPPFVFVLMPFDDKFDDVYIFGINTACEAAKANCERADEQYFRGTILSNIYNQIAKADVIIADMTGLNPNVYYETGYAHALGKSVILLIERGEHIPFDLRQYLHVFYDRAIAASSPTKCLLTFPPQDERRCGSRFYQRAKRRRSCWKEKGS